MRRPSLLRRPVLPRPARPANRPAVTPAMRQAARDLQLALQQLPQAPDFRRAASCALRAREVPIWFRQRQYRRFRPLIVQHLSQVLSRGASREAVMPGLGELVTALGLAEFEADYLRIEAESRVRTSAATAPRPDFATQLRDAQTAHRERLQTLESLPDLDTDTREQLLEQERMQFQERLRELAAAETTHAP